MGRGRQVWVAGLAAVTCAGVGLLMNGIFVSGSGAQVRQQTASKANPVQPHGNDFQMHTIGDENFCFSDQGAEGRPTGISQCAANSSQEWMFAQSSDNSSVIIDGDEGQCLQPGKKPTLYANVTPCSFAASEHFVYTKKGQIETSSGDLCLQAAAATQDAAVTFAPCVKGDSLQIFQLSH